jgi:hypothetical protein
MIRNPHYIIIIKIFTFSLLIFYSIIFAYLIHMAIMMIIHLFIEFNYLYFIYHMLKIKAYIKVINYCSYQLIMIQFYLFKNCYLY